MHFHITFSATPWLLLLLLILLLLLSLLLILLVRFKLALLCTIDLKRRVYCLVISSLHKHNSVVPLHVSQ